MKLLATAFSLALLSGCSDKSSVPAPPSPPPPQFAIRPATEVTKEEMRSEEAVRKSAWRIQIAQFRSSAIEQLGLTQLFDLPLRTNGGTAEAITNSPTFKLAQAETNVNLSIRTGAHEGLCSDQTASNMVQTFTVTAGVDLLTFPSLILDGTNQGRATTQSQMTIATGISTSGNPFFTNLGIGEKWDLRVIGRKSNAAVIEVAGQFEQFQGYSTNKGPLLDLQVLAATIELGANEVLLFGSKEQRQVRQIEERVPYISDIPTFGRLFIKRHSETNCVRYVVIIRQSAP
jgi:hypothetical protein